MAALDGGTPSLSSNTTLTVSVLDVNDNVPTFNETSYSFGVAENLASGTEVGVFEVTDTDQGIAAEVTFTLTGTNSDRYH